VASLIRRGGQSAHYQLRITFVMLPIKNCKCAFEYVKVIIRNIVGFFTSDTIKMTFSMTSELREHCIVLVKRIIGIMCAKIVKIRLNLLKLFTDDCTSFFRTRCIYVTRKQWYDNLSCKTQKWLIQYATKPCNDRWTISINSCEICSANIFAMQWYRPNRR